MSEVLIAGDAPSVLEIVEAAIARENLQVRRVANGRDVLGATKSDATDLVILDLQIGSMGGVAVSIQLAQEIAAGRLDYVPVLLLLDRDADRYLATISRSAGSIVKPIDVLELRSLTESLLDGQPGQLDETEADSDDTNDLEDEALASKESSQ